MAIIENERIPMTSIHEWVNSHPSFLLFLPGTRTHVDRRARLERSDDDGFRYALIFFPFTSFRLSYKYKLGLLLLPQVLLFHHHHHHTTTSMANTVISIKTLLMSAPSSSINVLLIFSDRFKNLCSFGECLPKINSTVSLI